MRKILHIDMDAFFASVEQRDDPSLRGKPVVVGGDGKRSVVAAASYEARAYGVFSAMPMSIAKQRCRNLLIVPHRFSVYKEVSAQVRTIFFRYTDLVEPLSLDEAYLDVTNNKLNIAIATEIAKAIKIEVFETTNLTCSAGVSINKFIAKIASGMNKPNGLTVIKPNRIDQFVAELPIEKFYGVGQATAGRLHALGIQTGADLRKFSEVELGKSFGKMGRYLYQVCRGIDERAVSADRIRKSVSVERTFEEDLTTDAEVMKILEFLIERLTNALRRSEVKGRTVQIKYRYPDFSTYTRSRSLSYFTDDLEIIHTMAKELFFQHAESSKGIRLLGIGLSNLDTELQSEQTQLKF